MGRKVFITSDMSIDERLATVADMDPEAALMWPWFLTVFDDWGRAEASPRRLKAKVFPNVATVSLEKVETALLLYGQAGLVELYEVTGKRYMAIRHDKWFKYQTHIRSSKRENDGSRCPPPPDSAQAGAPDVGLRADARSSAQERESARDCTPSPSPTPSPSLSDPEEAAPPAANLPPNDPPAEPADATRLDGWSELRRYLGDNMPREANARLVLDDVLYWAGEMGCDLVRRSIQESVTHGAHNWAYARTCLINWQEVGAYSLPAVEALIAQRKRKRQVDKSGDRDSQRKRPANVLRRDDADTGDLQQFIEDLDTPGGEQPP